MQFNRRTFIGSVGAAAAATQIVPGVARGATAVEVAMTETVRGLLDHLRALSTAHFGPSGLAGTDLEATVPEPDWSEGVARAPIGSASFQDDAVVIFEAVLPTVHLATDVHAELVALHEEPGQARPIAEAWYGQGPAADAVVSAAQAPTELAFCQALADWLTSAPTDQVATAVAATAQVCAAYGLTLDDTRAALEQLTADRIAFSFSGSIQPTDVLAVSVDILGTGSVHVGSDSDDGAQTQASRQRGLGKKILIFVAVTLLGALIGGGIGALFGMMLEGALAGSLVGNIIGLELAGIDLNNNQGGGTSVWSPPDAPCPPNGNPLIWC